MASQALVELKRQIAAQPFPDDLIESRIQYDALGGQFPVRDGIVAELSTLGGRPCEIFGDRALALANGAPVTLYLHGGGYTIGSPKTHRHVGAEVAFLTGGVAIVLDYRLAPEHPCPASTDDTVAAYRDLLLTYKPEQIVLAGDSAGGGLVIDALVAIRDQALPNPSCAYCQSPWVDLECVGESMDSIADADVLLRRDFLLVQAERYLGGRSGQDPLANPLFANLRGLPPMMIQAGSAEILLDDAIRLAERAGKAGVEITLEIAPDMLHVWPFFFPALPEGREALGRGAEFIRKRVISA
ncbi:alpha/beta hydrolase [Brevundimonas sp.]|uniref:alpha/beta hydrolase n=1 Tax=Brevundimonas sp. TaxID=1871086 RepID=UPI001A1D1D77|nr:alpha/beta hydrolase [Brevundimonas sp.]MBJ7483883.1 alpha/beta hydrolase [Brevundimonas sp.]